MQDSLDVCYVCGDIDCVDREGFLDFQKPFLSKQLLWDGIIF